MKNDNISLCICLLKTKVDNSISALKDANKEFEEALKVATEYNQALFNDARKIKNLESENQELREKLEKSELILLGISKTNATNADYARYMQKEANRYFSESQLTQTGGEDDKP